MAEQRFPTGFLWGVATSSHQIEGGNHNNWTVWERQPGHILDGSASGKAADFWHRYKDDIKSAADMHLGAFRLSIEWSRIEPIEGEYDQIALDHYGKILAELEKHKLKPFVTLHHFTLPEWTTKYGAWTSRHVAEKFVKYALKVVGEFGDKVDNWITINEPSVEIGLGYAVGTFPPGRNDIPGFLKARRNVVHAHREAYTQIHGLYEAKGWAKPQVSIAHHLTYATARNPKNPLDRLAAWVYDQLNNAYFLEHTRLYADCIGVNYYFYRRLYFHLGGPLMVMAEAQVPRAPTSDLGWQVVPEGLFRVLNRVAAYNLPIYVTENGLADADDDLRPWSIVQHAQSVHRAIAAGADVRGYFHWTLLDTFEWENGYSARYGLVAVDFKTQKRTPRPSAKLFDDIATHNALTAKMLERKP